MKNKNDNFDSQSSKTNVNKGLRKQRKVKSTFLQEIPLLLGLVFVWCALWQDFSLAQIIYGIVISFIVVKIFRFPAIELSGRFNIVWFIVGILAFTRELLVANLKVIYAIFRQGKNVKSAVLGVQLRSDSELIITMTEIYISLIPGSTVLELDRSTSTIYLHVFDVHTEKDYEKARYEVRRAEELIILSMGSKDEAEKVKDDYKKNHRQKRKENV